MLLLSFLPTPPSLHLSPSLSLLPPQLLAPSSVMANSSFPFPAPFLPPFLILPPVCLPSPALFLLMSVSPSCCFLYSPFSLILIQTKVQGQAFSQSEPWLATALPSCMCVCNLSSSLSVKSIVELPLIPPSLMSFPCLLFSTFLSFPFCPPD